MSASHSKVICYDLEMCCWENQRPLGEIISIGLCELDLSDGTIQREGHFYVKPRRDRVSKFCEDLTGISQRIIDCQGKPLQNVLDTITKNFGSRKPYVAWGDDATYLGRECRKNGFSSPLRSAVDVALLYKIRSRNGQNVSLSQALALAGAEFEGKAHNALVDAKNLASLIVKTNLL